MNQADLSAQLLKEIRNIFPHEKIQEKWAGDVVELEMESPKKTFILWLDTHNNEVSIGLADTILRKTTWHTHATQLDVSSVEDHPAAAAGYIKDIIDGRRFLVMTQEFEWEIDDGYNDENLPRRRWNEF